MPHSPEETRDVEFSGVESEKAGKIATGSKTTADPGASPNATSHDRSHVVTNGFHATNSTNGTTKTSTHETERKDSHTPEETRSTNRHPTSPWKSGTPSKASILHTPESTPRENGDGSRRSSQHYTNSTPHPPSSLSTPVPDRRRHHDTSKTSTDSIKFDKEVAQLKEQLADASPKALQKVLRDRWRDFLFEGAGLHHITFVIRALLKNATPEILDRAGEELIFKGGLLEAATHDTKVIDTVIRNADAGNLLASLSTPTIDAVVADRLKTVPAKTLIRWMAENDRLGYQLDDIIDDGESVSPNVKIPPDGDDDDVTMTNGVQTQVQNTQPPAPPHAYAQAPSQVPPQGPQQPPPHFNGFPPGTHSMNGHPPAAWSNNPIEAARERERHAESLRLQGLEYMQMQQGPASPSIERMQCPSCHYFFFDVAGFNYHVNKKICHKEPNGYKFSCTRCYQGFSTKQGQEYHCKKEVCASNDTPPFRESPSRQLQREATASTRPSTQAIPAPAPAPAPASNSTAPAPVLQSQNSPYPQPIPRPPFTTPSSSRREPASDIRQSPSELPPEKLAALNQELADEDARHARAVAQAATLDPIERANKLVSLKNGTASKKSQIRKKYGVSLRLRDKDKAARLAATTTTPPPTQRMNSNYISSPLPTRVVSAAAASPPTTGFSPINAAQRNGPSPNGTPGGSPLPPASYPAPQRPPLAPANPPLRHAQADRNSDSGFGMLVSSHPRYAPQNQMTTSTFAEQQRNGKRRRSEDDNEGRQSRRSSPYFTAANTVPRAPSRPNLSMMQVSAEDAASKYPRKPLAPGQARNYTPNSRSPVENAPSSTAPPRTTRPTSRDQNAPVTERPAEPVYISSEGEGDSAAAPRPRPASSHEVLPSIEGTGIETAGAAGADVGNSALQAGVAPHPTARGDATEDEESKRTATLETAEDSENKAEKAAAREEASTKESQAVGKQ